VSKSESGPGPILNQQPSDLQETVSLHFAEHRHNAAGTAYLIDVALGVTIFVLLLEIAASIALPLLSFGVSGLESVEEVLLKLRAAPPSQPYILVLGDSVMVEGALERARVAAPREHSIAARLGRMLEAKAPGSRVVSLAMEGALANDYSAIERIIEKHYRLPAAVVMQLDYRLLSPTNGPANLSRDWLRFYASDDAGDGVTADSKPIAKVVRPIDAFVHEQMLLDSDAYVLLRGWRRLARARIVSALVRQPELPPTGEDSVIRLLVTQYYRSDSRLAAGRPMAVVERVIDRLLARRIPVLVCFTPANFEYLGDRINAPMYEFNVSEFRELLRRRYQSDARFRLAVFEGSIPARLFLDHSHLSADGNELMAQMMVREFQILWSAKDGKS
jgi:hypothetical protein